MKTAGIICLILICLILAASYGVYRIVFYSPYPGQNDDHRLMQSAQMAPYIEISHRMIDAILARPFERVYIRSFDGLRLSARYYHQQDGAPLAICVHGYRGLPTRDFSGGSQLYLQRGMNLLMIEHRGHGQSEGHTICFGIKERRDVLSWLFWAQKRLGQDTPVVLSGISMGAATVLMCAGMELPDAVRGIMADCPYTTPKEIILKVAKGRGLPARLLYPFIWLAARLFGGFSLGGGSAVEGAAKTKKPILLFHGEADRFVPCEMSRRIAAANPGKVELHTFPDAGHGISFLLDRPRYERIANAFLDRILKENRT